MFLKNNIAKAEVMDYSNVSITGELINDIIVRLSNPHNAIYELNLLETGIKCEDIQRLAPVILENKTVHVLKIQTYADDPPEIKELITQMIAHVADNARPSSQKTPPTNT